MHAAVSGDHRAIDAVCAGSRNADACRRPGFNERYYGFRSFNELLEEARSRNLLELERDEKSGGYIIRAVD